MLRLLFLPLLLLCTPALAGTPQPPSPAQACNRAIASVEKAGRVPGAMMRAIALVESGRPVGPKGAVTPWPWTINAEGVGRYFDSKEEAIAAVQELQGRGVRSIDVSCMQINLMHHPLAFRTLDDAFDPGANAAYAARFLTALFAATKNWPDAAAAYHSQTPDVGADYQRRVLALWPEGARLMAEAHPIPLAAGAPTGRVAVMLGGQGQMRVVPLRQIAAAAAAMLQQQQQQRR